MHSKSARRSVQAASALALAISSMAPPAYAQTQQGGAAGAPSPRETSQVQEIIVTANKREQSINDVGITVAALTGADLSKRGIADIQDLAKNIPTLQYAPSVNNTPIFTIRGVGFVESSLAAYPTVSVSLDQIPLPLPALTALTAFDLERVEVLKGPQGTLFGQNSTGGAINFVAAKPTNDFSAGLSLTYGRFNRMEADGFVSGPLGEKVKARLAGRIVDQDAWQRSITRPNDKNGKVKTYAGRLLVDFEPSDGARFELNLNAWQDKSDPQAPQYAGIGLPQVAATVDPRLIDPTVAGYQPIAPDKARLADWTAATPPFANNRLYQAALRGDIDVTGDITLTSITSYIDYKTRAFTEGDGTALVVGDIPQRGTIKSFSQELRLSNDPRGKFRWIVGGNFSREKVYDEVVSVFNDQSVSRALGIFRTPLITEQTLKNYAVFGNVEYDISSQITLKGGLRYTQADRTAFNCNRGDDGGRTSAFVAAISDQLRGLPVGTTTILDSECFTLGTDFIPQRQSFKQVLNENNVSWRAGVDYRPMDDVLLYANVAKGYKAGSIPRIGATTVTAYRSVKQEEVLSYEVGFKAELIDRVLNLTGAAYWYDYKNKQLRTKIFLPPPSPFRTLEALDNIPTSRIRGAELEANLYPTRGLTLTAAAAYTDGEINRYSGVNAAGIPDIFDGVDMPFAPKWQFSASGDYEWQIGNVRPFIGATVNYRGKTTTIIGGERPLATTGFSTSGRAPFINKSYTLVDVRAGIETDSGLRVALFGKNIFDKFYSTNVFSTFETITRFAGMPATWGVTVGWKLN